MSLDRVIIIEDFITSEEILEVMEPLWQQDWHWFPSNHPYWDYSFTPPMGLLHRKLMERVPTAIPNSSFFFRYKPPHHAIPRIHVDSGFGEDNIVVYLKGPSEHGTVFYNQQGSEEILKIQGLPGRAILHSVDIPHKAWPEIMPEERIIWVCRYYHRGSK